MAEPCQCALHLRLAEVEHLRAQVTLLGAERDALALRLADAMRVAGQLARDLADSRREASLWEAAHSALALRLAESDVKHQLAEAKRALEVTALRARLADAIADADQMRAELAEVTRQLAAARAPRPDR